MKPVWYDPSAEVTGCHSTSHDEWSSEYSMLTVRPGRAEPFNPSVKNPERVTVSVSLAMLVEVEMSMLEGRVSGSGTPEILTNFSWLVEMVNALV